MSKNQIFLVLRERWTMLR